MELQRCHPAGASTHFTMVSWQRTESNGSYRCFVWQFSIYTAWNSLAGYIKGFSKLVAQNQLEGILATAWDDGSPHSETVWRGYIAQGEYGWNPTARTVEAFKAAHAQREFGFHPNDNHMAFLDELEQEAFFFDDALVNSGRRNPAWGTTDFTLISLPDPDAPGAWSRTYQQK